MIRLDGRLLGGTTWRPRRTAALAFGAALAVPAAVGTDDAAAMLPTPDGGGPAPATGSGPAPNAQPTGAAKPAPPPAHQAPPAQVPEAVSHSRSPSRSASPPPRTPPPPRTAPPPPVTKPVPVPGSDAQPIPKPRPKPKPKPSGSADDRREPHSQPASAPWVDQYEDALSGSKPQREPPKTLGEVLTGESPPPVDHQAVSRRKARIDELQDQVDDLTADRQPWDGDWDRQTDRIGRKQVKIEQQRSRLRLTSAGHCGDTCDLDAPFEDKGPGDDPFERAADDLGPGATYGDVADEVDRRREEKRSQTGDEPEPTGEDDHGALIDALEWPGKQQLGVVKGLGEGLKGMWDGGVMMYRLSAVNGVIDPDSQARQIDELKEAGSFAWDHPGEFGKSLINYDDLSHGRYGEWLGNFGPDAVIAAATMGSGTLATAGTRTVRAADTVADVAETARDADRLAEAGRNADRAADAASPKAPPTPASLADGLIERIPRLDDSPESRQALADILARTSSGTRANSSRPGLFNPLHTRGHSSELRTIVELSRRSDVERITPVPSSSLGRTPDLLVTRADGTVTRVEVTTVTGARPGYQPRGIGRATEQTAKQVAAAIRRKVPLDGTGQLDVDLPGVPKGGTLSIHLRGGGDAHAAVAAAMKTCAKRLERSSVDVVEFHLPGHRVLRYSR